MAADTDVVVIVADTDAVVGSADAVAVGELAGIVAETGDTAAAVAVETGPVPVPGGNGRLTPVTPQRNQTPYSGPLCSGSHRGVADHQIAVVEEWHQVDLVVGVVKGAGFGLL